MAGSYHRAPGHAHGGTQSSAHDSDDDSDHDSGHDSGVATAAGRVDPAAVFSNIGRTMEASLGWLIIAACLALPSMALLWPAYARIRRRFPDTRRLLWVYGAASVACSVALWFLIPPVIWLLFGRHGH